VIPEVRTEWVFFLKILFYIYKKKLKLKLKLCSATSQPGDTPPLSHHRHLPLLLLLLQMTEIAVP